MNNSAEKTAVVILAAGRGTRMKSDLAKVLHPIWGRAMIHFVVETALSIEADPVVVIVGHQKERVIEELEGLPMRFAVQEPQLGTGHAVLCALPEMEEVKGRVLILSGDVPLIRSETLKGMIEHHSRDRAAATVLTARTDNPSGYGRILRQPSGHLDAIIEERDADDSIRKINEINSGIYIFELDDLRRVLPRINDDNDQKEYYLTDAVRLLADEGKIVAAHEGDFREVMGVNTVRELQEAGELLAKRELSNRGSV